MNFVASRLVMRKYDLGWFVLKMSGEKVRNEVL